MLVVGLNSYLHDSAAALYQDGRLVAAVEEERLSRMKKDARFPALALQSVLDQVGATYADLDAVAFSWNRPGVTPLHSLRASLTGQLARSPQYIGYSLASIVRELRSKNGARALEQRFGKNGHTRVLHIDHHLSHALSAYPLSGFDEALVLVADGRGAYQATSLYHARGDEVRRIRVIKYPNSLGAFYEAFTDLLGFERASDEWKVMGLAAYGEPNVDLGDAIRPTPDGYSVNQRLLTGRTFNDLGPMVERFGERRTPDIAISQADRDLAASAQRGLEEALFSLVRWGVSATGSRKLCLAGGVAMNSKANGRILASGLVDEVFVQPAATDDGASIGAAVAAHQELGAPLPRERLEHVYLGPEFSEDEIASALGTYKLNAVHVEDVEEVVAGLLAEGGIVGWFQGRMEFGPRALGNRSILADPRREEMKDRVNDCVKFREGWRPFAPSCLEEAAGDYFAGCTDAPYMTLTFDVLPGQDAVIPAVTHADNTARVQTVRESANPRYWRLINAFARRTGVPVVLNTSFNLKGEPIVCSPKDAVRTFFSSGLDYLAIGNFVIAKDPAWRPAGLVAAAV